MSTPKKYAYSHDEERYSGSYDDPMQAAAEGLDEAHDSCFVGECVPPTAPEHHIDADMLLEHIQCQEGYEEEWADNWPNASKEQRQELTDAVQATIAAWIKRHSLEPEFYTIENVRTITREQFEEATK